MGPYAGSEAAGLEAAAVGLVVGRSVEQGCAFGSEGWDEAAGSVVAGGFGIAGWDGGRAFWERRAAAQGEAEAAWRGAGGSVGASPDSASGEKDQASARRQDSAQVAALSS